MKNLFQLSALSAALLFAAGAAQAGTVIYNTGVEATASIALGVNDDGSLNTSPNITSNADATGLAMKFADGSWQDATAPGCLCEGWGVSVDGTTSGYANVSTDSGATNLTFGAPTGVTGSTVTTTTSLTSLPGVIVTHAYAPADNAPGALFKSVVTIANTTGGDLTDVKYVRVMDWDIPPTEFSEFVTIQGTGSTTLLEESHDNGFNTADPLGFSSTISAAALNSDFVDLGPDDHGAYFRFNFGTLLAADDPTTDHDDTIASFTIFYGAATTESLALAAIGAEGIELYSLGQSDGGQITGSPATFIFGFSGVGGVAQEPPPEVPEPGTPSVPEPGTLGLLGLGLLGLGLARRRKA